MSLMIIADSFCFSLIRYRRVFKTPLKKVMPQGPPTAFPDDHVFKVQTFSFPIPFFWRSSAEALLALAGIADHMGVTFTRYLFRPHSIFSTGSHHDIRFRDPN